MKAFVLLICCVWILRRTLSGATHHTSNFKNSTSINNRNVSWVSPKLFTNLEEIAVIVLSRSRRHEGLEGEDNVPTTRHAKHRRRRRCRNRATCHRGIPGTRELSLRKINETGEHQEISDKEDTRKIAFEPNDNTRFRNEDVDKTQHFPTGTGVNYEVNDTDSAEEEDRFDQVEFEETNLDSEAGYSATNEGSEKPGYIDDIQESRIYEDDHTTFQENMSSLFTKLFQSLRNIPITSSGNILRGFNFLNSNEEDPCQKWLNSRDKFEEAFAGTLASLPGCPCEYPSNIFYEDKIWDQRQQKYLRWRDASGDSQRLDVYKPGAAYCIRSLLAQGSGSAAAQHCCYDHRRKLLTRGSGAGTPNLVSPEVSAILHERIDVLPWRLCKGDFSRYNRVRPPNNENNCELNPENEEYQRQINNTKYY